MTSLVSGGGPGCRIRTRVRVTGTVQGVGFRPFVFRIAHEERLDGHVLNDEQGVLLEVEGTSRAVERFLGRLSTEAPPLAVVDSMQFVALEPSGESGFRILVSPQGRTPDALVAADSTPCPDCLAELIDPADRRFRYPFINCTNCGPRFTIVRGVPYDRRLTTMAPFIMCAECRREYEDPFDRRFHAQPNACPRCGPRVRLLDANARAVEPRDGVDPITRVAAELAEGAVVAVKGLGGFHLVCDATDERAVTSLRARKHREHRPFAVMVASLAAAGLLVALDAETEELLSSAARPIVLVPRRAGAPLAAAVAPGAPELGLMLPYTPLHQLLLSDFRQSSAAPVSALVMTSGNVSDEPIAYRDEDALERLSPIADLFLLHDREIQTRTDDSVVRVVSLGNRHRRLTLRRSRGYVPAALTLTPPSEMPVLACGAEQKSTFCVAKGERAWVGHHVGDLEHFATLQAFREGIEHFERLFAVTPQVVAHDLHPDYLSTRYAEEREGVLLMGVQHHHAHLAACLAEHGLCAAEAVGAIFDGTGLGTDGTIWGGELLVGGVAGCERAGSLWPVRMPGGTAAIRQPWRMAAAWLTESFGGEPQPLPRHLRATVEAARWRAMAQIGADPEFSPLSSSMGRLLDAVGALCGMASEASYEGQAAVELEAAAWTVRDVVRGRYEVELIEGENGLQLDPRCAIRELAGDLEAGTDPAVVAARFHTAVAAATTAALERIAGRRGIETAVLSGGVFQNRALLESVATEAGAAGLRMLVPERLPPNDGGISFGQAAVVAARMTG